MKPLSIYIEYLLMSRHYVFVPGLGGLMSQEIPSRIAQDGTLLPPQRHLKFNRFMDHDDGMLANVLMCAEGMNYDEANQAIRLYVSSLIADVQTQGSSQLGRLGQLSLDADCHIVFTSSLQEDRNPVYYGLGQVRVCSWRDKEKASLPEQKSAPRLQIKRQEGIIEMPTRWVRYAAVAILVAVVIVSNLIPWNAAPEEQHYANLVDTGVLRRHALDSAHALQQTTDSVCPSESDISITDSAPKTPAATPAPSATAASTQRQVVSSRQYLVVVASCSSLKDAQRFVRRQSRKGYEGLEILERDGRYRVYISTFDRKREAISYLNTLRESSPFHDAWVLAVRPDARPLSYIIIIQDNDQLPMELSHLNTRAEKDQG